MKAILYITLGVLFLTLLLPLPSAHAHQQSSPHVVCTNAILADFTSQLLNGTHSTIDHIMPAGACPSHFDTRPSDVQRIASADIIVSLGWEPWLQDLLDASGASAALITCAGLGEWNLPEGARSYVSTLAGQLSAVFPDHRDLIRENAASYLHRINHTAAHLQELMASHGFTGAKVVCMEWQQAFASWLGLNVTASYGPPESLSTGAMLNISRAVSAPGVCAVIDNLQSGTSFGASVAADARISHVVVTNFPGAIPGTETYLQMLAYNTDQIVAGLSAHAYKQGDISELEGRISSLTLQRDVMLTLTLICAGLALAFFVLYRRK
ncbi:MAG: metal ABC transporter substrate-binding protein [Thermoplasmatota archaeon]